MVDHTQRQQQPRQPQPIKVAIETEEPEKIGDSWSILATAIVSQGNRTLDGREVQFFVNGIAYNQPTQTDDNGRAQIDIQGLDSSAKRISIEAQVVGQATRGRKIIELSKKEGAKKSTPAELSVTPRRIGNEINFFVIVTDEEKQGVKNTHLTIIDGHLVTHPSTDETGEYLHSIKLKPDEEREIGIYVAGYGDKGFCQTFRGREEKK